MCKCARKTCWLLAWVLVLMHYPVEIHADESEDALDQELSGLEEDDFPDLVSVDETGGIMDELDFLQDSEMVELAARHRQDIGWSPSAITVLTREDIDTTGASLITDLLRQVPGFEIVNLSPFFPSVSGRLIWNYENNTHLVLIDGTEFNMEVLGFAPWGLLPISLEDVERIEVIRGPGSSLYGANAMAGVINITTRAAGEESAGNVFVQGGEAGNLAVTGQASYRLGKWGVSISGGIDQASSWLSDPRTSGRNMWKARATLEYHLSGDEKLMVDGSISGGHGLVSSVAGKLDTDLFSLNLLARLRTESWRGHLYYIRGAVDGVMNAPLKYAGVILAEIDRNQVAGDIVIGELQWTVPIPWDALLVIVGGEARSSWMTSPQLLNARTFSDITHPDYHEAGLSYWEFRTGAFVHAEYTPTDWVTVTGGLRLDYNTYTGVFLSPRLTAVLNPLGDQFVRLGVARAFRKPSLWETHLHPNVFFPDGGIFVGGAQDQFREFMTRVVGNADLDNEKLVSFEAGYLGKFLDEQLSVSLDLYYNLYENAISMDSNLVPHETYLVDLEESSFAFINGFEDASILGGELAARYKISSSIQLMVSWTYRAVFKHGEAGQSDRSPKNMFTLGGRVLTDWGLLGSLFIHTRSDFRDDTVDNPDGLMEEPLSVHMDNIALVLARLGFRWKLDTMRVETGAKLHLPISPFSGPLFRLRERGGGVTPFGVKYGGDELTQILSLYLKATY